MKSDGGTVDDEPDMGQVDRFDMAAGWVVFMASGMPPAPEQLPLYLSKWVSAWLKQNPSLKVGTILPIVANANTIAVHVWFDGSAVNVRPGIHRISVGPLRERKTYFVGSR